MENTVNENQHPHRGAQVYIRQQLLILFLEAPDLTQPVSSWAFHDGLQQVDPHLDQIDEAPYETGLQALEDGWRVISYPTVVDADPDKAFNLGHLPYEFVFEKIVRMDSSPKS
jgi:hypothetical protein